MTGTGCIKNLLVKNKLEAFAPIIFMVLLLAGFLLAHVVAMIQYHSFWLNTLMMFYWLSVAVWNGACYYMDYFAKRYEKQMEALKEKEALLKTVSAESVDNPELTPQAKKDQ